MGFGNIDDWICTCKVCDEECIGRTPQQARKFLREHMAEAHPEPIVFGIDRSVPVPDLNAEELAEIEANTHSTEPEPTDA